LIKSNIVYLIKPLKLIFQNENLVKMDCEVNLYNLSKK